MEELFATIANTIATIVEFGAAVFIAIGALEAFWIAIPAALLPRSRTSGTRRYAYKYFGTWLMLALEFELAADIIRSAVTPNWTDIGQLAAIAVIRVFLNYFLERDLAADRDPANEGTAKA